VLQRVAQTQKQVRQWEQQTATEGPPVGTGSEREGSAKVRQREQKANARELQRSTSGNRQRPRGKRKGPPVGTDSDRERSARPGLRGRVQRETYFNHQRASEERNLSISERSRDLLSREKKDCEEEVWVKKGEALFVCFRFVSQQEDT